MEKSTKQEENSVTQNMGSLEVFKKRQVVTTKLITNLQKNGGF